MQGIVTRGSVGRDQARLAVKNAGRTVQDMSTATVHMIVHMGDFVHLDTLIRGRVLDLLDMISREDISIESWDSKMRELEEVVRT